MFGSPMMMVMGSGGRKKKENVDPKAVNVKLFDTAIRCSGLLDMLRLRVKFFNM